MLNVYISRLSLNHLCAVKRDYATNNNDNNNNNNNKVGTISPDTKHTWVHSNVWIRCPLQYQMQTAATP